MEGYEEKSHLESDLQNQGLGFQSDPPIDNDKVKLLTQELENLVISCEDAVRDRDLPGGSVVMDEEDEVKRAICEELRQLVVKEAVNEAIRAESSSEVRENVRRFVDESFGRHGVQKVAEEDPKECRVLEDTETGQNGLGHEKGVNQRVDEDDVDSRVVEHKDDDFKENHETEIELAHGSSEIVAFEYNGDERRSEDEHDREFENGDELENDGGEDDEGGSVTVPNDGRPKRYHYPLRPDAEDCSYYMRTGMCKFGSNCKFNHPLRGRNQQPAKETMKQKEENSERPAQIECKYYLSTGCKYGKACKFNHGRGKTVVTPVAEYNFLGLPIRLGEKECPYYMRNGSCKYGPDCRFNHPDPTVVGGDAPSTYGNSGPAPLQGAPQPAMPSWSGPRTPDRATAFVTLMYSPTQSMPPPNPDWNGYPAPAPAPAPVYPSPERSLPIPPAFFLNNPPSDTNLYAHHQPQMLVSEYPERPGQPECSYFMKTGDCKYKAACKFHHPKSRVTRSAPSVLSDKGLPLRPDQNICTHYSRYGICKFGPACKYDHPVNSIPRGGEGIQQV